MMQGLDPQMLIEALMNGEDPQLVGDVVPMGGRRSGNDFVDNFLRRQQPGFQGGSQGQQSIDRLGGPKNPYLDLLDVLQYPQGGQIRR